MDRMTRKTARSLSALAIAALLSATLSGCMSPFSKHAEDVTDAWGHQAREAHRKWDRYVLGLDWDDPYHEWHDSSFASGPMHQH
jgi:hypothetical protein